MSETKTEWRFEVTVWNVAEGDAVKYLRNCSEDELDELREQFDGPIYDVHVDSEWQGEADD